MGTNLNGRNTTGKQSCAWEICTLKSLSTAEHAVLVCALAELTAVTSTDCDQWSVLDGSHTLGGSKEWNNDRNSLQGEVSIEH